MSKSHNKNYRAQAAFSDSPEKTRSVSSKPEPSKSESSKSKSSSSEPIKLERVLVSDDFYWSVPGDVPASDRRYGMKMVPPGGPKVSDATETSNPSSLITNDTKEDANKPIAKEEALLDTATPEKNDSTQQFEKVTSKPEKEPQPAFVASTPVSIDTIKHDEGATTKPTTESKNKVAATILPRIDTGSTDSVYQAKATTITAEAEAKDESRVDSSQQQTPIVNKKIEPEQFIPSKPAYVVEEKNERSKWRPAWIVLPLLLLLAGGLYEAFNSDENVITPNVITSPVDAVNTNESETVIAIEQPQVADEAVISKAEVGQLPQVYYFTHVVVKGDTLWDISQKYLKDPFRYPELAESSNINNPDLIYPGEVITIATTQPVESSVQAQVSGETIAANIESSQLKPVSFITHVVVKGDTLWDISKKHLNNPFRYPELVQLSNIKNPDLIYPGDIVRIQVQ